MADLTIWYNSNFPAAAHALLQAGVGTHRLVQASQHHGSGPASGPADATLAEADVLFGQPNPDQVISAPRVRWIHLTTAGYTPYDRADFWQALAGRGAALTKSSRVFDQPCAEHALAFLLAQARMLPAALASQRDDRAWPQQPLRRGSRLLGGQNVLLFGFGSIGRKLAALLAPLEMSVVGVRRRVVGDEAVPTLAFDDPAVADALGAADHVFNLLPGSPATRGFFDAARMAGMKAAGVFYNIGRGMTVDQDALAAALVAGRLAAAYLDVTDPEPLPAFHPLWTTPNCHITPHTAGGHSDESERLVRCFLDNLQRFAAGQTLLDRVA